MYYFGFYFGQTHFGTKFADIQYGGNGNDVHYGFSGHDVFYSSQGKDTYWGGSGIDTVNYSNSLGRIHVNLGGNSVLEMNPTTGMFEEEKLYSIEVVHGSQFNDTMIGSSGKDKFYGNKGDDYFVDTAGSDYYNGGSDTDTIDYYQSSDGVKVNLVSGQGHGGNAEGDIYHSIENVFGTNFNDEFWGSMSNSDFVGGNGDDVFHSSQGFDTFNGGIGNDTADYSASDGAVGINLLYNEASGGHAQGDTLSGIESLVGSRYNDSLFGDGNNNLIHGGAGMDIISTGSHGSTGWNETHGGSDRDIILAGGELGINHGDGGDDTLIATQGIQYLYGDSGDDELRNDGADAHMFGGAGSDSFQMARKQSEQINTVIHDFEIGIDELDFSQSGETDWEVIVGRAVSVSTVDGDGSQFETMDGETVTLIGVDIDDLTYNDFSF